jgi:hypothetical protein
MLEQGIRPFTKDIRLGGNELSIVSPRQVRKLGQPIQKPDLLVANAADYLVERRA